MKPWIVAGGICITFLVGCSLKGIRPSATPTMIATPTLAEAPTSEGSTTGEKEPQILVPDLKAIPEGAGWNGSIQYANLVEKDGAAAIEFDNPNWNRLARWIRVHEWRD